MRLAALLLALTCCDSLAEQAPSDHESPPDQQPSGSAGNGGSAGNAGSAGSLAIEVPILTFGGSISVEPAPVEPEPDWCEIAELNGATFCETDMFKTLEYCEPAPTDGEGCVDYDRPPGWADALLLECTTHCGVRIDASPRMLEGSCCYTATSVYAGR